MIMHTRRCIKKKKLSALKEKMFALINLMQQESKTWKHPNNYDSKPRRFYDIKSLLVWKISPPPAVPAPLFSSWLTQQINAWLQKQPAGSLQEVKQLILCLTSSVFHGILNAKSDKCCFLVKKKRKKKKVTKASRSDVSSSFKSWAEPHVRLQYTDTSVPDWNLGWGGDLAEWFSAHMQLLKLL